MTSQLSDDRWRRSCESTSTVRSHDLSCASDHVAAGRGSIINTSSLAGVNGATGLPRHPAAKVEIIGFTQSVAKEVAGRGVHVNVIAPGPVTTLMTERSRSLGMGRDVPVGRCADLSEIAALVAFLVSDESRYIIGETVNVNDGMAIV